MTKEDRKQWFGGRRWTGYGAIAVLVLIAFLVAASFNTSRKQDEATPPAETPSVVTTTSVVPPKGTGRADDQPLLEAPSGISWQLTDKVALPFSAVAGPSKIPKGVASGFSHTATGALLAAFQTSARIGMVNPTSQRAEIQLMTIGDGKRAAVTAAPQPQLTIRPQYAGFRYVAYAEARAVISIAVRFTDAASGQTNLRAFEVRFSWSSMDWRYELSAAPQPQAPVLDDLTGYVPFGGV